MRRAVMISAVAVLVLIAFLAIGLVAPSQQSDTAKASIHAGISTFDLHLKHPGMKNMPAEEAPLP